MMSRNDRLERANVWNLSTAQAAARASPWPPPSRGARKPSSCRTLRAKSWRARRKPAGKLRDRQVPVIVLAVTWKAAPGREAEVAEIFRKLTAESRKEAGCLMYQVQRQQKDA